MGLVVSTGPPVESGQADTPTGDKKNVRKQPVDVVCREKNTELARYDMFVLREREMVVFKFRERERERTFEKIKNH